MRDAEAAGNTADVNNDLQLLSESACGDRLADVPVPDVSLPDVPPPNSPLPNVPVAEGRSDVVVGEE